MRIYKILEKTSVEGPNLRFCIWTQGCKKHCKGCFATQTWDFDGGIEYSVEELFEKIKNTKGIEGITFLGGEPFEQADEVLQLAKMVKNINLSVVAFSGYYIEELRARKINLENIDILIAGPFEEENFDLSRPWVGSKNQKYHFLTNRYCAKDIEGIKNRAEIRIQKNGTIFINGMGDFHKIKREILTKNGRIS